MTSTTVNVVLKLRRDTATNWASANPVLAAGEAVIDSTANKIKLGDGTTAYNSLGYMSGGLTLLDEDNFSSNSATSPPSQQSTKAYVDTADALKANLAGATFTGAIAGPSASFTDDGSTGPVINISGDDSNLWYGRLGNETYHNNLGTGFKFYVADNGDAAFQHTGNAEYRNYYLSQNDGTTTRNNIYVNTSGAVFLYHGSNFKLQTTAAGITVTGSITDDKGDVRTIVQNTQASTYTLVASDAGKHILASGNITWADSVFTAGQAVTIVNNTGGDITITKGTNMYNIADASNTNRTLGTRGVCTLLFTATDTCYISGSPLS